jgi:hypothetical protein
MFAEERWPQIMIPPSVSVWVRARMHTARWNRKTLAGLGSRPADDCAATWLYRTCPAGAK